MLFIISQRSLLPIHKKILKDTQLLLLKSKLSINFDSILSANHVPSGIIASAYLSRLAMVITAPPEATFNWLSSVTMLGSVDTSFQKPTTLGSETNIDPSSRTLNLTLPNVDIKPILFDNSYYIEVLGNTQRPGTFFYIDQYVPGRPGQGFISNHYREEK